MLPFTPARDLQPRRPLPGPLGATERWLLRQMMDGPGFRPDCHCMTTPLSEQDAIPF